VLLKRTWGDLIPSANGEQRRDASGRWRWAANKVD
jgi:hypothetical protein